MRVLAKHKYRAQRVFEDGYNFPSKREHARYRELKLMEKAGEIRWLHVHPRFDITWPGAMERICVVELDFLYFDRQERPRYEDVKGFDTALSKLKRKLLKVAWDIDVEIIK